MRQGEDIPCETFFRNESVGAHDVASSEGQLRMLRRAKYLGEFDKVTFSRHTRLFVSSWTGPFQSIMDTWS